MLKKKRGREKGKKKKKTLGPSYLQIYGAWLASLPSPFLLLFPDRAYLPLPPSSPFSTSLTLVDINRTNEKKEKKEGKKERVKKAAQRNPPDLMYDQHRIPPLPTPFFFLEVKGSGEVEAEGKIQNRELELAPGIL